MTHCENLTLPRLPVVDSVFYTGASSCGNCKIYPADGEEDKRPKCCDEYKCLWLLGHGEEGDRPDKSLMLFDMSEEIKNAAKAKPLSGNREKSKEGIEVINRMSVSLKKPILVYNLYENCVVRVVGLPVEEE